MRSTLTLLCAGVDPDCRAEADYCAANDYYGDGMCDRRCPRPDPDCAAEEIPPDVCLETYRYADGWCDAACTPIPTAAPSTTTPSPIGRSRCAVA